MDTAGMVMVLIGIYLLTSAIKNRRPVELAKKIVANPAATKSLTQTAEGYEPTESGPPTISWLGGAGNGGSSDSGNPDGGDGSNPTMALSNTPSFVAAGSRPSNVPVGVAAGVKPVTRAGLYSVARAFPQLHSFGGRAGRPGNWSDHPKGLAIDIMIPGWNTDKGKALGNAVANYFVQNATKLHVKYIIWNRQKWNPSVNNKWRPYTHPSGVHNATLDHRNHVHVSFKG